MEKNTPEHLSGDLPGERILQNVPLAPFTTIGIGGPARYFLEANTIHDLEFALSWSRSRDLSLFVLGGGSNLLIADRGFDGMVVRVLLRGLTVESENNHVMVKAGAGEPWDPFVAFTVANGWAGVECLSGIPGLIGATPMQNVGAYGQDVSETIVRVEALDRQTGAVRWFTNEECAFSYRDSIFKREHRDRFVILSVTYRLKPGGAPAVRYPELSRLLGGDDDQPPTLQKVRDTVTAVRRSKGMVIDALDPDTRSDGSFFTNPILDPGQLEQFYAAARSQGVRDMATIPLFPSTGNLIKLSAAWLIEHAGFSRGFVHGNVGLSSKHTLALINRGGATAAEVLELVAMIQKSVEERFTVQLSPEPNFIGFR